MITIRLATVVLLAAFATAQQTLIPKASNTEEPELPVVDYSGIGAGDSNAVQTVTKRSPLYDTWRQNRKAIGQLSEGEEVQEFGTICVTRKPDRFLVKRANPDFPIKAGDIVLQFQHWGDGNADIWSNGGWHRDFDWGEADQAHKISYAEKDGTLWPVLTKWELSLVEPGIREWWVRVSRSDGTTGWLLVQGNLRYMNVSSAEVPTSAKTAIHTAAPMLPFLDYGTCPGNGRIVPDWVMERNERAYSSFEDVRTVVGELKKDDKVTVLRGANIVLEPDKATIKYVGPHDDPSTLKVGDEALGFGVEPNQYVVFWAKGVWFTEWIEAVGEKGACGFTSGFGPQGCHIDIVEHGKSEWWVQIKASSGLTGWVLAEKNGGDKPWAGIFSDLCHYGED